MLANPTGNSNLMLLFVMFNSKTDYQRQFGVRGYSNTNTTVSVADGKALTSAGVLDAMVKGTGTGSNGIIFSSAPWRNLLQIC